MISKIWKFTIKILQLYVSTILQFSDTHRIFQFREKYDFLWKMRNLRKMRNDKFRENSEIFR